MVPLPGHLAEPIRTRAEDSGHGEEEGAAEHRRGSVVRSNQVTAVMPHPVRHNQGSAYDACGDVNVEERPFGAAGACENQYYAERSAKRDEEPTGFCRRSCPGQDLFQRKDEKNYQRYSPERMNHDSRKIGHACCWPRKNVRGREEQDGEQNRDSALHRSPGKARD